MSLPCPRTEDRGFTLIELLVAIAIAGVLLVGGMAAYRGIGEKLILKQAGEKLVTELRAVQKKALAGEKPSTCVGTLQSYRVAMVNVTEYNLGANCTTSGFIVSDAVTLPDTVVFETFGVTTEFLVLRPGVTGDQTITLETETGTFQYEVVIEPGGVIKGALVEL